MGCNCGNKRRALGGITSAETGRPLTPQESAMNAIANAGGNASDAPAKTVKTVDTANSGGSDAE